MKELYTIGIRCFAQLFGGIKQSLGFQKVNRKDPFSERFVTHLNNYNTAKRYRDQIRRDGFGTTVKDAAKKYGRERIAGVIAGNNKENPSPVRGFLSQMYLARQ